MGGSYGKRKERDESPQPEDQDDAVPVDVYPPDRIWHCSICTMDLSRRTRVVCSAPGCEEVDLCPACFLQGREIDNHKSTHPYRIVDRPNYPVYSEDWSAEEELAFIEGIQKAGLGNWAGAAEHVSPTDRSRGEAEAHYLEVYVASPAFPHAVKRKFEMTRAEFLANKRRRLEVKRSSPPEPPPPAKPPVSHPTRHEIAGYMPGRLEFDTEYEAEAEAPLKDLELGLVMEYGGSDLAEEKDVEMPGEDDEEEDEEADLHLETAEELEVKLCLIEAYNHRFAKRNRGKEFIFTRGLLEYKKLGQADRKRPKDERDLFNKQKPFAKIQTAEDFEEFVDGIIYESALKTRIKDLQDMRKAGLRSLTEFDKWEKDKQTRANHRAQPDRLYSQKALSGVRGSIPPGSQERGSQPPTASHEPLAMLPSPRVRKPPPPLNLANAASLHLLTPAEQTFCSHMRILPKPFLGIKEALVREYARRNGKMTRRDARSVLKIDVNKINTIWEFFVKCGLLRPLAAESPLPAPVTASGPGGVAAVNGPQSTSSAPKAMSASPAKMILTPPKTTGTSPMKSSSLTPSKGLGGVLSSTKPTLPSPLKQSLAVAARASSSSPPLSSNPVPLLRPSAGAPFPRSFDRSSLATNNLLQVNDRPLPPCRPSM